MLTANIMLSGGDKSAIEQKFSWNVNTYLVQWLSAQHNLGVPEIE
jgi:hypothetical protein